MKNRQKSSAGDRRAGDSFHHDLAGRTSAALIPVVKPTLIALAALAGLGLADALATQKEFVSGTSLTSAGNYNPAVAPGSGDNIVFDSGSTVSTSLTITAITLNVEDIAFSTLTTATIGNTTSTTTASTLELNGGRGTSTPLLDENSTKTLTIKNGTTGALNVQLDTSGSFEIDSSGGLTISSNIGQKTGGTALTITGAGSGVVALSGTNSFSGGLVAAGAEVDVTADNNLGAAGGSITINGGRLGIGTNSFTVDPTRAAYLGSNPTGGNTTGTLSIKGSITTTFNQGFQNLSGAMGDLVKQGGGTLALGGVSTYMGSTFLNNGITKLVINGTTSTGNLPSGTTLNLGQTASANTGIFDLNGINQQVAGLNSTNATTGAPVTKNTLTSSTGTSTLTLGGTGTYAYGDGSTLNSGIITGALSILKTGSGTQTLGDANTYTGSTTINGGTLVAGTATSGANAQALGGTSGVFVNGGGTLQMGAANQFNVTPAPVTLGGTASGAATFSINGNNQGSTTANGVGALTLALGSASNVVDFNGKAGVITFASLTTNGATLTINNYTGTGAAGGSDQLIFNQDETSNLASIVFTGYGAATEQEIGSTAFYEVFPSATAVPEPGSILGGVLTVALLGWTGRRRISRAILR